MAQEKQIESTRHDDKRLNNPTEELRGFVSDDEKAPKLIRYPRDPSLDPQLVWTGKDQQDNDDLEVDSVPIYIQETIQPQAIIENVRAAAQADRDQFDFFSDFNELELEELVDFYKYEQNWSNRMILGDSLLVMNSLAEKERLKGQVQMIYIDPPYGIKFGSNWQPSTRKRNVTDGKAEDVTRQPEQIKAYRDTWKNGIHSYMSYLRDRLTVAQELLTESGSVFVQISDENVHLVRCLMDEIFGSENFFSLITFKKTLPLGSSGLPGISDYLIWYAKDKENIKYRDLFEEKPIGEDTGYTWIEFADSKRRKMTTEERKNPRLIPSDARPFFTSALSSSGYTPTCMYDFEFEERLFKCGKKSWRTHKDGMERLIFANRIMATGVLPTFVQYHDDFPVQRLHNLWNDTHGATDMKYVVETSNKVVQRCLLMTTDLR